MNKKLELISVTSFTILMVCMLIILSANGPMEFNWLGKTFLMVLIGSMLGTIVPMMISKDK